jgi:hypothetical protein
MKRAIFSVLAIVVLAGLTGCISQRGQRPTACMGGSCAQAPENCKSCNDPGANSQDPGANGQDPGRCVRCRDCDGHGCRLCGGRGFIDRGGNGGDQAAAGPATGAITYPYYTNRGPRDFLAKNPASIGP